MQKDYRRINYETMVNTYELCNKINSLKESIKYSISNQKVILDKEEINTDDFQKKPSKVIISKKRTLEAASAYNGKKVAILNFANNHSIGGSPFSAGAQEECICRSSTLLPCLEACEDTFYQPHRDAYDKGLLDKYGNSDIIYTPNVTVFKTDESEPKLLDENDWYSVDVITCAAPEVRYGYDRSLLSGIIRDRIRKIIAVAAQNKVEVLILGAFGCGAFGNPPEIVAQEFYEITVHYKFFDVMEFAIVDRNGSDNYTIFKRNIHHAICE